MKMRDKKIKPRALSDIFNEYSNIYNESKEFQSEEIQNRIQELKDEAQVSIQLRKKDDKVSISFLFVVFILLCISLIIVIKDNNVLHRDNIEKANIINRLQWSDSLFNKIMQVELDTLGVMRRVSYRIENGGIVTYNELMTRNDSLSLENLRLRQRLSLISHTYDIEIAEAEGYTSIRSLKFNSLSLENAILRQRLELIYRVYNIDIVETDEYITLHAPKLDSALMLLPIFRDRLRYNPNSNTWSITR